MIHADFDLPRALCAVVLLAAAIAAGCSRSDAPAASTSTSGAAPPAAAASLGTLPTRLCAVLVKKAPEIEGMPADGARAQLVMAIATAFDANAEALQQVSAHIDEIAASGCAQARASLLVATSAPSLQEAVR